MQVLWSYSLRRFTYMDIIFIVVTLLLAVLSFAFIALCAKL